MKEIMALLQPNLGIHQEKYGSISVWLILKHLNICHCQMVYPAMLILFMMTRSGCGLQVVGVKVADMIYGL